METPAAVLRACYQMIPRLTAEDSLRAYDRIAAGTGHLRPSDRQTMLRTWKRAATRPQRAAPVTPEALVGLGIGVRRGRD